MEDLRVEVGHVGHDEDEERLQDAGVVGEPGDEAGEVAPDDTDEGTAEGHHQEGGEALHDVRHLNVALAHVHVGLEHVVEDDGDGVVEQRLAKDDDVEDLVHVDLLEDGQHGHRVHGHDQGGEQERLQDGGRVLAEDAQLSAGVQRGACTEEKRTKITGSTRT